MTLKEIAERAGVSRGTVDRVMKNRGGVNPETEKRVRRIVEESGYTPNRAGVALVRSKRPMVVGVITNSIGNPFFEEVYRGVEEALGEYRDYGFSVLRREIKGYDVEEQISAMRSLFDQVDGLVFTPIDDAKIAREIGVYAAAGKPAVTVTADVEGCDRVLYVGCDYYKSGQTAAKITALATGGQGEVAIVTGSFKMLGHNDRVRGFRSVLKDTDLRVVEILECNDDDKTAYEKTARLLKNRPALCAVYVAAAGVAGTVEAVAESGVPLFIIANDLIPATREYVRQGRVLATIDQQPARQGYAALKNMFDILLGERPANERFYTDLAIRMQYNI